MYNSDKLNDLKRKAEHCTTHHYACDCREAMYQEAIFEAAKVIERYIIVTNDSGLLTIYNKLIAALED